MASVKSSYEVKSWTHTTPGYPETLKLATTHVPAQPAPHHLLVKVKSSSVNPVDIQIMNIPIFSLPYLSGTKLLSRDFAGIVLAASPESGFAKDDEVCGFLHDFLGSSGGLTEVVYIDMRKACVVKKPPQLTWNQAASLPLVYLTARTSIGHVEKDMTGPPEAKKLVVLGGSSSTGIYTVKLAKRRGWTVLASCSGRNADFVKSLGADEVVDYTTSPTAVVDAVKKFGPSAVIDNVGGTETIGLAAHYVTIVGDKTSRSSLGGNVLYLTHPRMLLRYFLGRWGLGYEYECIVLDSKKEFLEEIGTLKGEEVVIDSVFGFEQVTDAFERMNTGRCRGKVVVEVEK